MNEQERHDFLRDITTVAVNTDALIFPVEEDETGAVQYALYPRRRMPLEYAVQRRRRRIVSKRGHGP